MIIILPLAKWKLKTETERERERVEGFFTMVPKQKLKSALKPFHMYVFVTL